MPATSTNPTGAVEVARSFFAAYNARDVGRMVAACSEDARLRYVPMGDHGHGKVREVGQAIWSGLIDAFLDLAVTVQSVFGDERHGAAEVAIGGTQRKDFLRIPSRGRHYELPHAFLLRLDDRGQITEIAAYWDNASFYSQLGKTTLDEPRAARPRRPRAADAGPNHGRRRMDGSNATGGTQWPAFGAPRRPTAASRRTTPIRRGGP